MTHLLNPDHAIEIKPDMGPQASRLHHSTTGLRCVRLNKNRSNAESGFKRMLFVVIAVGLVGLGASGCAVNPVTGRSELQIVRISEEEEIALGAKAFLPAVQEWGGFYKDPLLEAYVQEVGMRLGRVSHRPNLKYQFRVVNSSVPNAFALPGGFIVINRGLLVALDSEGEMAAVLGHEIVHVTARHSLAGYQRALAGNLLLSGVSVIAGDGIIGLGAQALSNVTASLIQNGFSREQEREADSIGMEYMVRGGYSAQGMVSLQEFFYKKLEGDQNSTWITGLFRTHPFSVDRFNDTRNLLAQQYQHTVNNPNYVINREIFLQKTAELRRVQKAYDVADQGDKLFGEKKYKEALAKYQEAVTMEPRQAPFHSAIGKTQIMLGNHAAAQEHLVKAIELDGELFEARLYLGALYYSQKNYRAAIPELEKSMSLIPTKNAATMLSKSYEAIGDAANAKKYADMLK